MIINLITDSTRNNTNEPSIQDDSWVCAISDNSGVTNMKYVFDVYDEAENQLIRAKVYPNPSNGYGYLNVGSIIRNEVRFDWFTTGPFYGATSFLVEPKMRYSYTIDAGEDVSGITTTNLQSEGLDVYNFREPLLKSFQYVNEGHNYYNSFSKKINNWLTNRPKRIKAGVKDNVMVGFRYQYINEGDLCSFIMNVGFYDAGGNLLGSGSAPSYPFTFFTYDYKGIVQMDLSVTRIQESIDNIFIDVENCDESGVAYYVVSMDVSGEGTILQFEPLLPIIIDLDCCPRYEVVNLHFINNYGVFDTARFSLVNRLTSETERKTFQKNDYQYNNENVDYFTNQNAAIGGTGFVSHRYNESKINYGSKTNWKYKLTMDFPTDAEYEWLNELITSPQIYATIDGDNYPVTITNTNYEYSKHIFNGLKQLEIEIELNQTRFGFRR